MIYTVTVNPCLDEDKYFNEDVLVPGTNRAHTSEKYPGGKGIDVSRAIHAVGSRSVATGFIGGNIGNLVKGLLAIEGIECDFVEIQNETRTNVICHMADDDEIRINSTGPTITGNEYNRLLERIKGYDNPAAGLVCGSVCGGMEPIHSYVNILSAFKQGHPTCQTFLDTGENHTMAALDGVWPPDFIKPNIYEFHELLRVKVNQNGLCPPENLRPKSVDESNINEKFLVDHYCNYKNENLPILWELLIERLCEFAAKYPKVHVLLTISDLGAITINNNGEVIHAYYCGEVDKKTTVGAGDSFLGSFATSYIEKDPGILDIALKDGVATAVARLQGQHRDYGYIDQGKLQQVLNSDELILNTFEIRNVKKYVIDEILPNFNKCKD